MRDGDGAQGQKALVHKMPSERLWRPARTDVSATPPRLRPKGPVGPDFRRQFPAAAGTPKQSAVERLEADKAKYVKSQVALSKQLPARPPARSLADGLQPTRKAAAPAKPRTEGVQLDVKHLTNLISNVGDGAQSGSASEAAERPRPPPRPDWSSPAKVRLKVPAAPRVASNGVPGPPAAGTVRRVDVLPPASPARTPCRPPLLLRKPLHPISLSPQFQLRPTASRLHPSHPRTPGPSPLKPVVVAEPSKPEKPPADPPDRAAPAPPLPPSSPARTRLSSSSSRKRPSLTRSKSDLSDRCSRAGTELERFFNLCGLDPADLPERARSTSDIVSMVQFHSVSAPGSECGASNRDNGDAEEEEEEAGAPAARVPYGVSVIERNARVIKWLYGLRSAKDDPSKSTDL